jgi:hypothetical protein
MHSLPGRSGARTCALTSLLWPRRAGRIPTGCSSWRSASGAKPVGPTARRVGTGGAPTAWSGPVPRAKPGARLGEKRPSLAWTPRAWTGPGRMVRGLSLPMHSPTGPSVGSLRSIIAVTRAGSMTSEPMISPRGPPGLAAAAHGLGRACLDAAGPAHRWVAPLSSPPRRGLERGAPSTGPVAWRQGYRPSRGDSGGPRAQAPGGSAPPMALGPSEPPGGPAGGPHEKTAGRATRRVVRLTPSGRPASPAQHRTAAPGARQPWAPPGLGAAGQHGAGVCVMRAALSAPDCPRHTGPGAAACPAGPLPR